MTWRAVAAGIVACLVAVHSAGPARAEPATAEELFREGRRLLAVGKLDEACRAFARSHEQSPSSGALLNLALCHEQQGKVASAWGEYLAAARLASTEDKNERAGVARDKARSLEPRLCYVTVSVDHAVDDIEIRYDGTPVRRGAFGARIPIDPGQHQLVVRAPGRATWERTFEIAEGETREIRVPRLERVVTPARPMRLQAGPAPGGPVRKRDDTVAYAVGGAGLALFGAGSYFGIIALGDYDDAKSACPELRDCSAGSRSERARAETEAWIANFGIGLGLTALAVSGTLLLWSGDSEPAPRIQAWAGPASAGVRGSF